MPLGFDSLAGGDSHWGELLPRPWHTGEMVWKVKSSCPESQGLVQAGLGCRRLSAPQPWHEWRRGGG